MVGSSGKFLINCQKVSHVELSRITGPKTHPKSRNTKLTPRLHELFRRVRANFCHPTCDTSQEPKGNCPEKLVQMHFFILVDFFGFQNLVAQTLHHLCCATAVALHWCRIFRLMFSQCRRRITLHPLKCLKKALSHPFGAGEAP